MIIITLQNANRIRTYVKTNEFILYVTYFKGFEIMVRFFCSTYIKQMKRIHVSRVRTPATKLFSPYKSSLYGLCYHTVLVLRLIGSKPRVKAKLVLNIEFILYVIYFRNKWKGVPYGGYGRYYVHDSFIAFLYDSYLQKSKTEKFSVSRVCHLFTKITDKLLFYEHKCVRSNLLTITYV